MKKMNIGIMVLALLVPLIVGGISATLSAQGMLAYGDMNKPPLSPPPWVFSVAWTILYLMMGAASYFVLVSDGGGKHKIMAMVIYGLQLAMNFMWSILFFNYDMYLFAFIWLMVMWCMVIICAFRFFTISKLAAYMLIPYILWLTFAAYLNLGTYLLNK